MIPKIVACTAVFIFGLDIAKRALVANNMVESFWYASAAVGTILVILDIIKADFS